MILLSITGLFKMALIILGVLVVLRLIGRMMVAKGNLEEEKELLKRQRESEKMVADARQNYGKTSIGKIDKKGTNAAEYTDFEEIKE